MSSTSESRASSAGPSSFTENLTLYLNGSRDYVPPSPESPINAPGFRDLDSVETKLSHHENQELKTLKLDLDAALRRQEDLLDENTRLKEDLKRALSSQLSDRETELQEEIKTLRERLDERTLFNAKPPSSSDMWEREELQKELKVLQDNSSAKEKELKSNIEQARQQNEQSEVRIAAVREQADAHLARVQELESKLTENMNLLEDFRRREAENQRSIQKLESKLELQGSDERDELDDQSLIEELEDDLERTRQELDRIIKDKKMVERQLDFAQSSLEFEQRRTDELEKQIARARLSASNVKNATVSTEPAGEGSAVYRDSDFSKLKTEFGFADVRIQSLERKIAELSSSQNEKANGEKILSPDLSSDDDPKISDPEQATMQRAEAYIRKIKAQEQALKADLRNAQSERDDLRFQLRESHDAHREAQKLIETLRTELEELRNVKERMGRVLMYQWGKEEVGEIERDRKDGIKERGMGFRYKYFNKDGTPKRQ